MKTSVLLLASAVFATTAFSQDVSKGEALYNGMGGCGACHGPKGAGDGAAAAALNPKPRSFLTGEYKFDTDGDGKTGTENDIYNVLTNGAVKYGGAATMVAYQHLSDEDRRSLAKYLLSLRK